MRKVVRNKRHRHKSPGRRRRSQGYVHQHHSLLHELLLVDLELRSRLVETLKKRVGSRNPGYIIQ